MLGECIDARKGLGAKNTRGVAARLKTRIFAVWYKGGGADMRFEVFILLWLA
jgi:hypothetical protein